MAVFRCETGRIATVTLDRPPANALDRPAFEELIELLGRLRASAEVRAVVLTGTGRFFSAGLDLFEVFAYPPDRLRERALEHAGALADRDPVAFEHVKIGLRAHALRHIDRVRAGGDPVWDIWRTPHTRALVEAYKARTLGKRA